MSETTGAPSRSFSCGASEITKQATKEIADGLGKSVTFMAKYDHWRAGSSSHVHQSLWTRLATMGCPC